jgi:mannose-6-phosphate isomerase-like protein (cupin superfamily)
VSRYTRINIADVEDAAVGFGLSPALEARFARTALGSEVVGVSRETLAPGFRVPFGHTHRDQEEVYVVVRGSGRMKLDDEILELVEGDVVRVAPGVWRCTEAGADGLQILAVGAPIAAENDAELAPGWWADDAADDA